MYLPAMLQFLLRLLVVSVFCCSLVVAEQEKTAAEVNGTTEVVEQPSAVTPATADQKVVGPIPSRSSNNITTNNAKALRAENVTNPLVVLGGLALIVALIYGCAWLMKRVGGGHFGAAGGMKIIAGISVGPREKVLLLEVGEQQVLVGVAPGRVSHLQTFPEPVITSTSSDNTAFADKFKSMLSAQKGEQA